MSKYQRTYVQVPANICSYFPLDFNLSFPDFRDSSAIFFYLKRRGAEAQRFFQVEGEEEAAEFLADEPIMLKTNVFFSTKL